MPDLAHRRVNTIEQTLGQAWAAWRGGGPTRYQWSIWNIKTERASPQSIQRTNQYTNFVSRTNILTYDVMDSFTYGVASDEEVSKSVPSNEVEGSNSGYTYCVAV
ncbi:hypothetical protein BD779DRAFT_1472312 [Infundibulicybe gibba]|nr:hypothetical protein BD779DRAFT_1472312 [Infundibulicybe gibba]